MDIEAQFSLNQSRAEEITMREDYGNINLVASDEGFGDMGFDTEPPELMRGVSNLEPSLDQVCHQVLCILALKAGLLCKVNEQESLLMCRILASHSGVAED